MLSDTRGIRANSRKVPLIISSVLLVASVIWLIIAFSQSTVAINVKLSEVVNQTKRDKIPVLAKVIPGTFHQHGMVVFEEPQSISEQKTEDGFCVTKMKYNKGGTLRQIECPKEKERCTWRTVRRTRDSVGCSKNEVEYPCTGEIALQRNSESLNTEITWKSKVPCDRLYPHREREIGAKDIMKTVYIDSGENDNENWGDNPVQDKPKKDHKFLVKAERISPRTFLEILHQPFANTKGPFTRLLSHEEEGYFKAGQEVLLHSGWSAGNLVQLPTAETPIYLKIYPAMIATAAFAAMTVGAFLYSFKGRKNNFVY